MFILQFLLSVILFVSVFMGTWWVLLNILYKYGERVAFFIALSLFVLIILTAIIYETTKV